MKRQFIFWCCTAVAACALLAGALIWGHNRRAKAAGFPSGDPHRGARLFETKGCVRCHRVNGRGGRSAPDLGSNSQSQPVTVDHLVAAMWTHAPAMVQRMKAEQIAYPTLEPHDVIDLATFLYTAHSLDECGNTAPERRRLAENGCLRCHNCVPPAMQ